MTKIILCRMLENDIKSICWSMWSLFWRFWPTNGPFLGGKSVQEARIKITQYIPKCVWLSYMVIIWGRIPSRVMRDSLHWVEKNPFIKMRVVISFHRKLPVFWPWYVLSSNTSWLWFPIFKYPWSKFKSLEVLLQKRLQPLTLSGLCGKTQWIWRPAGYEEKPLGGF